MISSAEIAQIVYMFQSSGETYGLSDFLLINEFVHSCDFEVLCISYYVL